MTPAPIAALPTGLAELAGTVRAVIPSPTQGVWYLGPVPIRAYALCILLGILVAVRVGERRWIQRGGPAGTVLDVAVWAVPFGIVGGRLYHVATSWQPYFGPGGEPVRALYIWEGGLGIWGAVALGSLGAWIGARRAGVLLPPLADSLAPGIALAQAIGRWGNWFNNELYGRATDLPWGLRIYRYDQSAGHAITDADGRPVVLGTFHPTFLYECLWDVGVAGVLIWLDRRLRLGHGRVFALYVVFYTLGRAWIEALRVDPANRILGLRLNLWTSLLVGVGGLVGFVWSARNRPGREQVLVRRPASDVSAVSAPGPSTGAVAGSDAEDVNVVADADDSGSDAVGSQASGDGGVVTEATDEPPGPGDPEVTVLADNAVRGPGDRDPAETSDHVGQPPPAAPESEG